MLKNMSQLEYKIGDKIYNFICDNTSPLNEVKEALFQFLKYIGQVEDAIKAQQEKQAAEAASKQQEVVSVSQDTQNQ